MERLFDLICESYAGTWWQTACTLPMKKRGGRKALARKAKREAGRLRKAGRDCYEAARESMKNSGKDA